MHIGDKIFRLRKIKGIKQTTMADTLGITRPGWQKQEASGKINEAHWPAIEKKIGMNKEQLEGLDEDKLDSFLKGQSHVYNNTECSNYVCVVNLHVNGSDVDSIDKIKGLF